MDLHAIDLVSMARLLTDSEAVAHQAVSEVISRASVSAIPSHGGEYAHSDARRTLAALLGIPGQQVHRILIGTLSELVYVAPNV